MSLDFSAIPILDHHAHSLLRQPPAKPRDWLRFFTESTDPDIIAHHVPHTLFFQFAVKALAGLLGCEPKPEAVLAERDKLGQQGWAKHLIQDAGISGMLIDYGFQSTDSYPHDELTKLIPCRIEPILRLETLAQQLILRYDTWDQVLDAFIAEVEGAQKAGYVLMT